MATGARARVVDRRRGDADQTLAGARHRSPSRSGREGDHPSRRGGAASSGSAAIPAPSGEHAQAAHDRRPLMRAPSRTSAALQPPKPSEVLRLTPGRLARGAYHVVELARGVGLLEVERGRHHAVARG